MSTSLSGRVIPLGQDQFEHHLGGAHRAAWDRVIGSLIVTLVTTAAATALALACGGSAVTVIVTVVGTLVITYALAFLAGPWARRRELHLAAAEDTVRISPEVLTHTEWMSPALAIRLSPGGHLNQAHILAYRTRVANVLSEHGDLGAAVTAMLAEREEESHSLRAEYLNKYFSGAAIGHSPSNDEARAEIERVVAEFMTALTSPENLVSGDPLSDTSIPEVARVHDALAATQDPAVNLPETAREFTMAWIAARELI